MTIPPPSRPQVEVVCQCGKRYKVAAEHAGRTFTCKACNTAGTIPIDRSTGPNSTTRDAKLPPCTPEAMNPNRSPTNTPTTSLTGHQVPLNPDATILGATTPRSESRDKKPDRPSAVPLGPKETAMPTHDGPATPELTTDRSRQPPPLPRQQPSETSAHVNQALVKRITAALLLTGLVVACLLTIAGVIADSKHKAELEEIQQRTREIQQETEKLREIQRKLERWR